MNQCSLAVQGSYKEITLALFRDTTLIDCFKESSSRPSSSLIPCIDTLLNRNAISVGDLLFIACEAGPGAFTSLRVILSTINGIGFASGVPLISVDGLEALAYSGDTQTSEYVVSLLNAYNNEVYYGIYARQGNDLKSCTAGYCTIEKFIELWQTTYQNSTAVAHGNGAIMFKEMLQKNLPTLTIPENVFESASIEAVNTIGREKFLKKESEAKLTPLYLKTQTYTIKS